MKYFLFLFFLLPLFLFGQSLTPERITKIKAATVRVIVEGGISVGSGFFIDERGILATCWHVFLPALQNKKRTIIEFNNGDTAEVGLLNILINDTLFGRVAAAYDFCLLAPVIPLKTKVSFLKLGDFSKINEEDEIYTCGYPLGYPQQFVSRGMLSTKYINHNNGVIQFNKYYNLPRNEALLDITLNKGNSGGAIVKVGETIDQDEVIGIADFAVNPLGNRADSIVNSLSNMPAHVEFNVIADSTGKVISGNDPNKLGIIFAQAIGNISIGVSGCIAINHVQDFLSVKGMK